MLIKPERKSLNAERVQFEVSSFALQQLLLENRLSAQELHCLNSSSKQAVKQMLLNNLAKCI